MSPLVVDPRAMGRVLITGATGFVGGAVAQALALAGVECHAIVRPSSDSGPLVRRAPGIVLHAYDDRPETMAAICRDVRPNVAFHIASLFIAEHSAGQVDPLVRSNILFPTLLTDALVAAGVRRLVNVGTSWQHYQGQPYSPVCLYAATKQSFEALLAYYVEAHGLDVVTLALFDTYGPGDPRRKLFHLLRQAAASGETLRMSGGEQGLDLVHIDDVVRCFLMAANGLLENRTPGMRTYAVRSGNDIRLRDLVDLYGRVTGRPVPVEWGARPYRQREVMSTWQTGGALPGWSAGIDLADGIRAMEGIVMEGLGG